MGHAWHSAIFGFVLLLIASVAIPLSVGKAQQTVTNQDADKKVADAATPCPESDQLRKNVQQLTGEVQRLKTRVAELEKDRLATTIQEQLEKEEQRGEALQLHLYEISEKEVPLQARMDQINQQLRPETMERSLAGVGSVHPEDLRDDVKKRLMSEKVRLQMQLDLLRQDRMRTQGSLATTDAAIQRLKQKLLQALRP
jgi:hypothetical protein